MKLRQLYPADEFLTATAQPPGPPIGPAGEPYQPPVPRDPVAIAPEPLTIDITGGREMTWWEANQPWVVPLGFVLLFWAANR